MDDLMFSDFGLVGCMGNILQTRPQVLVLTSEVI